MKKNLKRALVLWLFGFAVASGLTCGNHATEWTYFTTLNPLSDWLHGHGK
jgi:hypothetical protein